VFFAKAVTIEGFVNLCFSAKEIIIEGG